MRCVRLAESGSANEQSVNGTDSDNGIRISPQPGFRYRAESALLHILTGEYEKGAYMTFRRCLFSFRLGFKAREHAENNLYSFLSQATFIPLKEGSKHPHSNRGKSDIEV